jgi:hypothetical protein
MCYLLVIVMEFKNARALFVFARLALCLDTVYVFWVSLDYCCLCSEAMLSARPVSRQQS